MAEDEMEELIRELLEVEDVAVGLLVVFMVEEELAENVEDLEDDNDFVDNEVLDDDLLGRLLAEFEDEDDLVTVGLGEEVDVGDDEDDLESLAEGEEVVEELTEKDSRDVLVEVREEVVERDAEIELVDVRVIKDVEV